MKSKLLFHCNLNQDTLDNILKSNWKICDLMTEKDFENILMQYDNYASSLPKCDSCSFIYMDSTINYQRCYN